MKVSSFKSYAGFFLAIDKIRTASYKPATNGNIERFHATMHSMIAKWVSSNQRDWDDKLPAVAFAYRTTVHEATGFTPYFLMHGREARLPANLMYGEPDETAEEGQDSQPQRMLDTLHQAFETARTNLGKAARHRKAHYDLQAHPTQFSVGTWVWCLVTWKNQGWYQKWRSLYEGPFKVLRQLGPVTYEIGCTNQ